MIRLYLALACLVLAVAPARAESLPETLELPVLTHDMMPGDIIAEADVAFAAFPAARVRRDALTDPAALIGQTPRRRLRAGTALREADLRRPVVVRKGQIVTLTYEAPGISLTASGRALADGGVGETIRVTNSQSHRTIEATVTGQGLATVTPPSARPLASRE